MADMVGNNNPPPSADYLSRRHNVIAELKALEADSFGESFRKKLGDRAAVWQLLAFRPTRGIAATPMTPPADVFARAFSFTPTA